MTSQSTWALADPAAAIDVAKSISDEPLRERLFATALVEWSEVDSEAAARAAALEVREGCIHDDAIVSISQRWALTAPEAAAEPFPPGRTPEAAKASGVNAAP